MQYRVNNNILGHLLAFDEIHPDLCAFRYILQEYVVI